MKNTLNLSSDEVYLLGLIDRYNELLEEKNTRCHSQDDFKALCNEINRYKHRIDILAYKLNVAV